MNKGPLDLSQIVRETFLPEERVLETRNYLFSQGVIERRPDRGYEKNYDPMTEVIGI